MKRRTFIAGALAMPAIVRAQGKKQILVAEPFHSVGYLPLYMAAGQGYFEAEGITAQVVAMSNGGSAHTNAVLSGQAFAFIGGPEHDAFAKAKGGEMRAVVNVVDRGNVYMVAKHGMDTSGDVGAVLKGKKVGALFYGGTPNSVTRYVAIKAGLKLEDFTIVESTIAATLGLMKAGQIDIAVVAEPQITQGIRAGLWDEPFYNTPQKLGQYAYSVLNVRQESIDKEPETVKAFVRAMLKALKAMHADPKAATEFARKEFPTMPADDLQATMDRSFADKLWSLDGMITEAGWKTAKDVVMTAGLLKQDVPYSGVIDMQFVKSVS